jgi:hypothetical protein
MGVKKSSFGFVDTFNRLTEKEKEFKNRQYDWIDNWDHFCYNSMCNMKID